MATLQSTAVAASKHSFANIWHFFYLLRNNMIDKNDMVELQLFQHGKCDLHANQCERSSSLSQATNATIQRTDSKLDEQQTANNSCDICSMLFFLDMHRYEDEDFESVTNMLVSIRPTNVNQRYFRIHIGDTSLLVSGWVNADRHVIWLSVYGKSGTLDWGLFGKL